MTDTNTPTPWRVLDYSAANKGFIAIVGGGDPPEHIADVFPFGSRPGGGKRDLAEHKANAELIVRAVNAHDDLVSKARAVVASSHKFQDGQHDTKPGCVNVDEAAVVALNELLIALAKAKAVQS